MILYEIGFCRLKFIIKGVFSHNEKNFYLNYEISINFCIMRIFPNSLV